MTRIGSHKEVAESHDSRRHKTYGGRATKVRLLEWSGNLRLSFLRVSSCHWCFGYSRPSHREEIVPAPHLTQVPLKSPAPQVGQLSISGGFEFRSVVYWAVCAWCALGSLIVLTWREWKLVYLGMPKRRVRGIDASWNRSRWSLKNVFELKGRV